MVSMAKKDSLDLLHVPAFSLPFKKICPYVITVHDLIGIKFENQKGAASRFYWKSWLPGSLKHADAIIAISEHTRNDLIENLKINSSKIKVIRPSGHESFRSDVSAEAIHFAKAKLGICFPYFVTVGSFEPRKNLERVIKAFGRFLAQNRSMDAQLVMIGPQDFAQGRYFKDLCIQFGINEGQILATGFVDHDVLNALYAGAEALIFASLYEGFGLPLLEAMASRCPVLASKRTSLPEVAGEAAAWFDPESIEDISDNMSLVFKNTSYQEDLRQKGLKRILNFSWEKCAQETFELYRKVLE